MKIIETPLSGLIVIEPKRFEDERGFFLESYQEKRYAEAGITDDFVQENHSRSVKNVLRGMHFQVKKPQAQIITIIRGCVYDVCIDLRLNSPSFGQWYGTKLGGIGCRQIYMAPGFAHGFCVLSEYADLHYKVSQIFDHSDEAGLVWNDADVGIKWPDMPWSLSLRDREYPHLSDIPENRLPCM